MRVLKVHLKTLWRWGNVIYRMTLTEEWASTCLWAPWQTVQAKVTGPHSDGERNTINLLNLPLLLKEEETDLGSILQTNHTRVHGLHLKMDLHIKLHSSTGSTDGLNAAFSSFIHKGKKKGGRDRGNCFHNGQCHHPRGPETRRVSSEPLKFKALASEWG